MRGDKKDVSIGSDRRCLPNNSLFLSLLLLRGFSSGETTLVSSWEEAILVASCKIRRASSFPRTAISASAKAWGEQESRETLDAVASAVIFGMDFVRSGCDGDAAEGIVVGDIGNRILRWLVITSLSQMSQMFLSTFQCGFDCVMRSFDESSRNENDNNSLFAPNCFPRKVAREKCQFRVRFESLNLNNIIFGYPKSE